MNAQIHQHVNFRRTLVTGNGVLGQYLELSDTNLQRQPPDTGSERIYLEVKYSRTLGWIVRLGLLQIMNWKRVVSR